ncbi:MAG: hypothetical protein HOO06_09030 [Bdellovibrionaceae bacterium]|nr:hypothetical protein [Pseudobdellovibrionaceae bacterium]
MNKLILVFLVLFTSQLSFAESCEGRIRVTPEIYPVCDDAYELMKNTNTRASEKNKLSLFIFGRSSCPWCQSLNQMLVTTGRQEFLENCEVLENLEVQEIPSGYYYVKGDEWAWSHHNGGDIIKELHKKNGSELTGVPVFSMNNPDNTNQFSIINTASKVDPSQYLEKNTKDKDGHDPVKVCAALTKAFSELKKQSNEK